MARIPLQIAERSLGTGSVVQYPSSSPVGAALEGFGNSLQSAALRVKEKQDQKDAFDAAIRENEMTADIAMMEDEAGRNIAADGSGLHDGVYGQIDPATDTAVKPGSFDALFDSYLSRMPESKRQDFAAKRDLYRKQGSVRLAGKQYEAEQAYYKVEIQKTHNQIANAIGAIDPNDTATFEAFRSQGVDIIDKSGLPALEKDVAKVNWIANADETLFKTRLAKDPDFATKARAALGLAPSESSVTGAPAIQSVVDRIIGNESSGDPNAQNPRSSAGGLGGFIDSTWVATVRKFRPDIARGMSNDQIIELKTNGQLAREMTTRHVEENAGALQASGLSPSARNLYLAHFLGQSGAASLLSADDGAAVSSVVSAEAVKANPEVLGGGKTVGDVKAWAAMKMGGVESDMPKMATGPVPPVQFIDQTAGKIRDKPVQGWVKDGIARAAFATDSRISVMVVSGGQSAKGEGGKRTGSTRHDHGDAADIVLMLDGKPVKPGENKELYAAFFRNAAANGFTGLGHYEWGIHVGGGAQAVWGPDRTSGTLDPTFAKAAADGWGNPVAKGKGGDPQYASIPFERKLILANQADAALADRRAQIRGGIDVAVQNAPYAIQNTGQYSGPMPTREQFVAAYGAEGESRHEAFQSAVETSQQAFAFQTMPASEIQQALTAATPISSGADAELETKRYETISQAAAAIMKAREADPAGYVRQAFPSVDKAWDDAGNDPNGYRYAVAASVAAQQQLGMRTIRPIPGAIAAGAVDGYKDENRPVTDRIDAVASVLAATDDPAQRRMLFEQLVDAGLPPETEGAMSAMMRGDKGAALRLFEAAMVDVAKLPGKIDATGPEIDAAVQDALLSEGSIGDIYYGLSDGTADNLLRAQRDNRLLSNAVNIRMRRGEDMDSAVEAAAKDLFGDLQVVNESNAQILLPKDADVDATLAGLESLMPDVRGALRQAAALPGPVPASDGTRAIIDATTANRIEDIMANGYFRNSGEGFVFIDPYAGEAVADEAGEPVVFTLPAATAPVQSRPRAERQQLAPMAPGSLGGSGREQSLDDFLNGPVMPQ